MTRRFVDDNVEFRGREARALHLSRLDSEGAFGKGKLAHFSAQVFEVQAGVEESAKDHVAAGAREAVEVGDTGHVYSERPRWARALIWAAW